MPRPNLLTAAIVCAGTMAVAAADVTPHGPVLRVTPSEADQYIARGTLPLPQGWIWEPHSPFGLRRAGKIYPAQWWPVAFHPDGTVSVVELAARVDGEPSLAADPDPIDFEVVVTDEPYAIDAPSLDPALVELVTELSALQLRARDAFGHEFTGFLSRPLESPTSDIEVLGRAKGVYTTDDLLYRTKGPSSALPYLGAFKAWYTVHDGGRVVELDLRWHNAVVNPGGPMVPDVIFDKIDLLLPPGWEVAPRWPMPTFGSAYNATIKGQPKRVQPLIENGPTPHILRQRGNLTWRVVLHREGDEAEVADAIDRRGWGTVRGEDGGWQDPTAAAWLATHTIAPDLTPWADQLGLELRQDRDDLEQALTDGTPYFYSLGVGALGPYHTIGVTYGGMTGGSEIFQTPGTELLWTAENDGLVAAEIKHRMILDRQFGWFYGTDSDLITAFDIEGPDGALPINVFNNEFVDVFNNGALGFESTPDVYADVMPRPEYEDTLVGTTPYDGLEQYDAQHGIRALYPLKVLIWGANDRMARHDLIAQASLWHMELHDGPGGRLQALLAWANQHPGVGGEFGRGEAWIVDAIASWYALGNAEDRAALDDWITTAVSSVWGMRTPLDVFYGNRVGKITEYYEFDEQYAIIQWYEHAIALNALAALRESWASTPQGEGLLEDLIVNGALAIWRTGWKPGTNGPWEQQAVAWMDPDLPAFATPGSIPDDGAGGWPDNDQVAGPLGLAGRYANAAESAELHAAAAALTGSGDPLQAFEQMYTFPLNLNNRAALIAWLQLLEG